MINTTYELRAIGTVESPLVDRDLAPKQGDEGAPDAWLQIDPSVTVGLRDLMPGMEILVLTWLDRARRDVLVVHPRDDPANPEQGVFSTRSADRPNPIGVPPRHNRRHRRHADPSAEPRGAGRDSCGGHQTSPRFQSRTLSPLDPRPALILASVAAAATA